MRGTSLRWTSSPRRGPARHKRISRREGDTRLGQVPATESIGIRGYRLPKGEACRLSENHPCIRVRDCGEDISGGGGIPSGEVRMLG